MRLEPTLFNRAQWQKKRARLAGTPSFLLDVVVKEASERLSLITRSFDRALLLGACPPEPLAPKEKVKQWFYADVAAGTKNLSFLCDDEQLPLRDQSLDLIVHLLMLHHANQVPMVLRHFHRTLRPDGVLLACAFAPSSLAELKTCLLEAEMEIKQGAAQRFMPLTDIRTLGNGLQASGFALPVADTTSIEVLYPNLKQLLADIRATTETQHLATAPPFLRRDVLTRAEAIYQKKFSREGKLVAHFHFAWLLGWKPDPSQPKPLAPGSAKTSLAAAVKGMGNK